MSTLAFMQREIEDLRAEVARLQKVNEDSDAWHAAKYAELRKEGADARAERDASRLDLAAALAQSERLRGAVGESAFPPSRIAGIRHRMSHSVDSAQDAQDRLVRAEDDLLIALREIEATRAALAAGDGGGGAWATWSTIAGSEHSGPVVEVDSNVVYVDCIRCHRRCCVEDGQEFMHSPPPDRGELLRIVEGVVAKAIFRPCASCGGLGRDTSGERPPGDGIHVDPVCPECDGLGATPRWDEMGDPAALLASAVRR